MKNAENDVATIHITSYMQISHVINQSVLPFAALYQEFTQ